MKRGGPADLEPQLQSLAKEMGATYSGIADLTPARQYVVEQGGEFLSKFPRAVSHGFVLADGIIDALADHGNVAARSNIFIAEPCFERLNQRERAPQESYALCVCVCPFGKRS